MSCKRGPPHSASAGIEYQAGLSSEDRDLFSKAQDYVKKSGVQESFTQSSNYAKEGKYSTLDDEGERYSKSIGASLEDARSHREEASVQHQRAESYTKTASSMKQYAATWNASGNQDYVDWLKEQPLPNSKGPMGIGEAAVILSSRPELDRAFQQRFIEK